MYRFLKILHLLGLTLFLGSIFGHIVASVLGGEAGSPGFLFARQEVTVATRVLTMPGLALAILSGIGMAVLSGLSPLRVRWFAIHGVLAVTITVIAIALIMPAGGEMLARAITLRDGSPEGNIGAIMAAKQIEDIAGAANVLLTLVVVSLGVWKPKL